MSLQQWLENSWIKKVEPTPAGVANLLAVASRDLQDASLEGMSCDGRFEHAYDAVRCLAETALYAAGYTVPKGERKHERLIRSLPMTIGGKAVEMVDHLDRCRVLRHKVKYERAGLIQGGDADRLLARAKELQGLIAQWLKDKHLYLLE